MELAERAFLKVSVRPLLIIFGSYYISQVERLLKHHACNNYNNYEENSRFCYNMHHQETTSKVTAPNITVKTIIFYHTPKKLGIVMCFHRNVRGSFVKMY